LAAAPGMIQADVDANRTFLKRKGGLFKKAHELSVLCSVDVAVIIFGNNKKLYEYSSSDIGEILQRYNFVSNPAMPRAVPSRLTPCSMGRPTSTRAPPTSMGREMTTTTTTTTIWDPGTPRMPE
jgi:MADS-box transcription factor